MNCPKCRNPIADNVAECEWCGVSFTIIGNDKQGEKAKINNLDAELISLLKQEHKSQAIELYKKRTGANNNDSAYHVARLNFFLKHEHASEATWRNHVKKSKRKWFRSRLFSWILLPIVLFFLLGSTISMFLGEIIFVLMFLPALFITFLLINWMHKTKRI